MKVVTLTEQKRIVGNLTQWQRREKNTLSREAQELQPTWFSQHGSQLALWPLITSWSPSQAQSPVLIPDCSES